MASPLPPPRAGLLTSRGLPWLLGLAGLIYIGWGVWSPPVDLVVSGGQSPHSPALRLEWPIEYLLLAPVTRFLDELSLLDDTQHLAIAWTLGVVVTFVALRTIVRTRCWVARLRATARATFITFGVGLGVYLTGALVPRPMAALIASDPDVVLVDFHSHTERSHDGRWRFSAESNRAWHAAAGFHAAYVTDHQTMEAWQGLAAANRLAPPTDAVREAAIVGAAARPVSTTLLPGIESVVPGAHLNLIGVGSAHLPLFHHRRDLDTAIFAALPEASRPLALLTLPFNVERDVRRPPAIDAIELTTGAPKGRRFAREHRARIRAMADSLEVPLVASSNLHGWGSTAAAWTAMHIEGWQHLAPLALDGMIRETLGRRGSDVWVAERISLPAAGSRVGHALTLPRLAWHAAGMATPPERTAVVGWGFVTFLVIRRRMRVA